MPAGSRGGSSRQPNYPEGVFRRASDGAEIEVNRSSGMSYPIDLRVRWLAPNQGEGLTALNEAMSGIMVLEIDHLARAVARGEEFHIDALKTLALRDGWQLVSRLPTDPTRYSLVKDGESAVSLGARVDLLQTLELAVRCALEPFEGQGDIPSWVERSREVYPEIKNALKGMDRFEQVNDRAG